MKRRTAGASTLKFIPQIDLAFLDPHWTTANGTFTSSPQMHQPEAGGVAHAWFDAPDEAAQKAVCVDLQRQAMIDLPSVPVGQFQQPTAHSARLRGVLPGFATFWNVRPA